MAKIIIIAALGKNKEIGLNNDLIWHLKEDLKFFKEQTFNHKIIMGYNTFLSLPKILPNRKHLVLTHHNLNIEEVVVFNDFSKILAYLNGLNETVYVIGGAKIYKLFLPYADELMLTEIMAECINATVYFPNFNKSDYLVDVIGFGQEKGVEYVYKRYRRKKENG